jgi:hypothetical protein
VTQPLVVWLVGIALLVALLVVGGAVHEPVVFVVAGVAAVALVASYLFFSRSRRP